MGYLGQLYCNKIDAPTKRKLDLKKIDVMKETHNFDVVELWSSDTVNKNKEIIFDVISARIELI